jgi:cation:H+ antiporter
VLTGLQVLQVVAGIAVLFLGAEWLIRGSATLARALGVKALVIGLTVVAYGTSAPELAVATRAAHDHATPLALGNVIGSCAVNISLILGLTALIAPPTIDARIIRREVPVLLGSAIAVPVTMYDGLISRAEGLALIGCAVLFTLSTLTISARQELADDDAEKARDAEAAGSSYGGRARPRGSPVLALAMSGAAVALLVVGSTLFVDGARGLGGGLGMSERMIGLTVVAVGTALPELIASVVAAVRGHSALAVGSVIGANLLNVFLVLGIVAYLYPVRVGERMHVVDLVGLMLITLLGIVFMRGSRRVSRVEGAVLVAAYAGFVTAAALL